MKNIDVIRELIGSMDGLDERNEAIRYGIYAILEKIEAPEACRDAGWSIAKQVMEKERVKEDTSDESV